MVVRRVGCLAGLGAILVPWGVLKGVRDEVLGEIRGGLEGGWEGSVAGWGEGRMGGLVSFSFKCRSIGDGVLCVGGL